MDYCNEHYIAITMEYMETFGQVEAIINDIDTLEHAQTALEGLNDLTLDEVDDSLKVGIESAFVNIYNIVDPEGDISLESKGSVLKRISDAVITAVNFLVEKVYGLVSNYIIVLASLGAGMFGALSGFVRNFANTYKTMKNATDAAKAKLTISTEDMGFQAQLESVIRDIQVPKATAMRFHRNGLIDASGLEDDIMGRVDNLMKVIIEGAGRGKDLEKDISEYIVDVVEAVNKGKLTDDDLKPLVDRAKDINEGLVDGAKRVNGRGTVSVYDSGESPLTRNHYLTRKPDVSKEATSGRSSSAINAYLTNISITREPSKDVLKADGLSPMAFETIEKLSTAAAPLKALQAGLKQRMDELNQSSTQITNKMNAAFESEEDAYKAVAIKHLMPTLRNVISYEARALTLAVGEINGFLSALNTYSRVSMGFWKQFE